MFYAQFVLAKKGPLAKIWLAAHWEKKLTKAQIYETDVRQAVNEVIRPKVKMALRTTGHLLLGIVRVYSRKTRYLLADTNEACIKMKLNSRIAVAVEIDDILDEIDTDQDAVMNEANVTIPEFLQIEDKNDYQTNLSRLEDITISDEVDLFAPLPAKNYDFFGDDFGETIYGSSQQSLAGTPLNGTLSMVEGARDSVFDFQQIPPSGESLILHDLDDKLMEVDQPAGDLPLGDAPADGLFSFMANGEAEKARDAQNASNIGFNDPADDIFDAGNLDDDFAFGDGDKTKGSFALEPLDLTHIGARKGKKTGKKRRLIIDEAPSISNEQVKQNVEDFSDTIAQKSVAPPTKKMMQMCVTGDLKYLMETPGMMVKNKDILNNYKSMLVYRQYKGKDEFDKESSSDLQLSEDMFSEELCPIQDSRVDDFDDMNIDFDMNEPVEGGFNVQEGSMHNSFALPMDAPEHTGVGFGVDENKENEDEWRDPFAPSSRAGSRLEDYGFGKRVHDDGKWSKRSSALLKKVDEGLKTSEQVPFSSLLTTAKTRKAAAESFYALLTLAKANAVVPHQDEPYGDILISAGSSFKESLNLTRAPLASV